MPQLGTLKVRLTRKKLATYAYVAMRGYGYAPLVSAITAAYVFCRVRPHDVSLRVVSVEQAEVVYSGEAQN